MKNETVIIDYGMGNLRSVQKAIHEVGGRATISSDPAAVEEASKLVLPGVGAFEGAVTELKNRGLFESVKSAIASGTPFLGICLGFQLLFDSSEESPGVDGLGIFRGSVLRIPPTIEGVKYKVPHMGWNTLEPVRREGAFENLPKNSDVYFVHSYYVYPSDARIVSAYVRYGLPMCASVASGNVVGYQFHPEKSGPLGLSLLRHFVDDRVESN